MRRTITVLAALVMVLGAIAIPAYASSGVNVQRTDMFTFDGDDVGRAKLVRTHHGVYVSAVVNDDTYQRGDTVTIWWVVWEDWENCPSGECGSDDIDFEDPELVGLDIGYATGRVIFRDGKLRLRAWLSEGQLAGFPTEFGITTGDGLVDASTAEIHIVVRDHGPIQPGLLFQQISTFAGGCDYSAGDLGGSLPPGSYGAEGNYVCGDTHFAVFPGS